MTTEDDFKLLQLRLEAERMNVEHARRARDEARDLAAECRLKYAEERQRAEVAERTVADLQREVAYLEKRLKQRQEYPL